MSEMSNMEELPQPEVEEVEEPEKTKNDRIIEECKKRGEPYVVFRAKDNLSVGVIQFYLMRAVDEKCPAEFVENMKGIFDEFTEWRRLRPWFTRMPD